MRSLALRRPLLVCLLAACAAAVGFWWLCARSERISFLPAHAGAEWIVHPKPADAGALRAQPNAAVFSSSVNLPSLSQHAKITLRAFKTAALLINSQPVPVPMAPGHNWKLPVSADVTEFLRAGTNTIIVWVTNMAAPPALWLRLDTTSKTFATDESWKVSLIGMTWENAHNASGLPDLGPSSNLYGGTPVLLSLRRIWPTMTALGAVALICVLVVYYRFAWWRALRSLAAPGKEKTEKTSTHERSLDALLAFIILARAALFIHDLPLLPRTMGFDAAAHEDYIRFIQEKQSLPLPSDGWEMHQPPLYYLTGAALLGATGYSVADQGASALLKGINGLAGAVHCWIILLCLRLLFPGDFQAQAVGLLFAAFLPPHLYLSQYVTNEPLAWLFVSLSIYFVLRSFAAETNKLWIYIAAGLSLGAGILTRFTAVLVLPFILLAVTLPLLASRSASPSQRLKLIGSFAVSCFLVCGWHYGRVWLAADMGVLPNWEKDPAAAWWQDPGYRTSSFYLGFGQGLNLPLFSGFNSFADGLFTTLWGDGAASGAGQMAFRPPWNYDLMNSGYCLAVVASLLLACGFVLAVLKLVRSSTPESILIVGSFCALALGVVYISLHSPCFATIKAFYALPAIVPLAALLALGWRWLARGGVLTRLILWTFVIVWSATAYSSFWVRANNPQTHLVQGLQFLEEGKPSDSIPALERVLQSEPGSPDAHFNLAIAFERLGQEKQAVTHYRQALSARMEFPAALNNLAWLLASGSDASLHQGFEAVDLAQHACASSRWRTPVYIGTLAAAYARAGRFGDAVAAARHAISLASATGQAEIANRNRELLELYQAGTAYRNSSPP